jgi:hypothetical protein
MEWNGIGIGMDKIVRISSCIPTPKTAIAILLLSV